MTKAILSPEKAAFSLLWGPAVIICALFSATSGSLSAQQTNIPTFGSVESHDIDSINLQSLIPMVTLPIRNKPGAIPFSFSENMSSTCVIVPIQGLNESYWSCGGYLVSPSQARSPHTPNNLLGLVVNWTYVSYPNCPNGQQTTKYTGWYIYSYPDGRAYHPLPVNDTVDTLGCLSSGFTDLTQDDSGLTLSVATNGTTLSANITNQLGNHVTPGIGLYVPGANTEYDPFGNTLSVSSTFAYQDTLSTTPVTEVGTNYQNLQYVDANGNTQTITFALSSVNMTTGFGCYPNPPVIDENGSGTVLSSISYPDGTHYQFGYEAGPSSGSYTGRLASITLRTGGSISYSYGNPDCTTGYISSLTRTTQDGTTTYTSSPNGAGNTYTTVIDPGKNKTVYYFTGRSSTSASVLTEVQVYQNTGTVASPVYTLLTTDLYCYNGNTINCQTASANYPVRQVDRYRSLGTMTTSSRISTTYDGSGNVTGVAEYDFGASTFTTQTTTTYGSWNGSMCVAVGSNITGLPCDVVTKDSASPTPHTLSETRFTYNSKGAVTAKAVWTGSSWLTTNYSPNSNGTIASATSPNGQVTSFGYAATGSGGCNGLLPTSTSTTVNGVQINTSQTWDCNGAKLLSSTDANSNVTHYTYDLLFRPTSVTDPLGFAVNDSYTATTATTSWSITGASSSTTNTVDGLGRTILTQTTAGSQYNTTSNSYQYIGPNQSTKPTYPCLQPLGTPCSAGDTDTIDPLGRPITVVGSNGGTSAYVYNQNDIQVTISPAPTGENSKVSQTEADGLGRVKSTCGILTSGGSSCGQAMGGYGIVTATSYSFGPGSSTVTTTRGAQTRTTVSDALGRPTSISTPEAGTITNTYDSATNPCGWGSWSSPGDLIQVTQSDGTSVCLQHNDPLHRLTDVGNNTQSSTNFCKRFRYDTTSNPYRTPPSGYTAANIKGRLMEAETDDCSGTKGVQITDEWFAYDADGRITEVWEWTPHSGGYYHTTAGYYLNGELNGLSGIPGFSAYSILLDSNGRPSSSSLGATNLVYSVSRDGADRPTTIKYFGGTTTDTYGFNPNGTMNSYGFATSSQSEAATLTWNANGTVGRLAITDGFNAGGTQTCNYLYDDIGRLGVPPNSPPPPPTPTSYSVDCGSSLWRQVFSYDQYDNLTKTGNPGTSWSPGYNAANNQAIGFTYNGRGDTTYDLSNTYSWDAYNKMYSARYGTSPAVCGTSGRCITYDAFGRAVEKNVSGAFSEFLYSAVGMVAIMNGQTLTQGRLPLPGGASLSAIGGTNYVNHYDWLGSTRLQTAANNSVNFDAAYSPYGEIYDSFGAYSTHTNFTGDFTDVYPDVLYDTPNRELDFAAGARWLSPDPAGASWNAYAYGTDPNRTVDPTGLLTFAFLFGPYYEDSCLGDDCGFNPAADNPDVNCGDLGCRSGLPIVPAGSNNIFSGEDCLTCGPTPSLLNSIWSDVLGLPSGLNCPQVGGLSNYLCGGVSPLMDLGKGTCANTDSSHLNYFQVNNYAEGPGTASFHIQYRHINPLNAFLLSPPGQYETSPPQSRAAMWDQVQFYNAMTRELGTQVGDGSNGGSIVFTYTFPMIPYDPWDWSNGGIAWIGRNQVGQPTGTNKLVLAADCKTVITSYPQ